jgi:sugar lactone lactonase YvrE
LFDSHTSIVFHSACVNSKVFCILIFSAKGKKQSVGMGTDGIASSADGSHLYYYPLASRKLYSVDTKMPIDRGTDEAKVATTVTNEGDRRGAFDANKLQTSLPDKSICLYSVVD